MTRSRSQWLVPAVLLAIIAALVWRLNAGSAAEAELRRVTEATKLRLQGELVTERERSADLERVADQLASENLDLKAGLERARKRGARVVLVVRGSTGPVPAEGQGAAPDAAVLTDESHRTGSAALCLLAAGDEGEVRVTGLALETRAGNRILVGAAEAFRTSPAPPTRLFGGPLRAELSSAAELDGAGSRRDAGWGVGLYGSLSRSGWAVGPAVSPPPQRVWRWAVEEAAGAAVGPAGEWTVGATVLVRGGR